MPEIAGFHYRWLEGEKCDKSPIVLIHGAGMDSRLWPHSFRSIAGHPVLIVDLPGHGSSQSTCCHSIAAYVRALYNLLGHLEIREAILVGVGLGGSMAMEFVCRHPDRSSGFIVINAASSFIVPESSLELIQAQQYPQAFIEMIPRGLRSFNRVTVRTEIENIVRSQRPSVLAADLLLMYQYKFPYAWETLAEVPGLFLFGTGDRILGSIPMRLPGNLRILTIPGRGHWLPLEDPDLLRQYLLSFLSDLPLDSSLVKAA